MAKKLDSSQIQFWMLIVNSDKSAVLTCEQDNESVITQQIPLDIDFIPKVKEAIKVVNYFVYDYFVINEE